MIPVGESCGLMLTGALLGVRVVQQATRSRPMSIDGMITAAPAPVRSVFAQPGDVWKGQTRATVTSRNCLMLINLNHRGGLCNV